MADVGERRIDQMDFLSGDKPLPEVAEQSMHVYESVGIVVS